MTITTLNEDFLSSSINSDAAERLAAFIDQIAGGYPFVSGIPGENSHALLWQYERHDFILYFDETCTKFSCSLDLNGGSPTEIQVNSVESALDLIMKTESIRQRTIFPYVALGRIPGTAFK